jgi:oxygen-independent coproporphyrinogen III oxidase
LLAFGVSAISAIDNVYMQNAKNINDYQAKLDEGLLPYIKGFTLNKEDELRKFIINQLICHFELSFKSIKDKFSVDMQSYFTRELQELTPMIDDGLISVDAQGIRVHNAGRMLIRRICMVFDEYLNNTTQIRYSKII